MSLTKDEIESYIAMHKAKIAELKRGIPAGNYRREGYISALLNRNDNDADRIAHNVSRIKSLEATVLDLQDKLKRGNYKKNGGKRKARKTIKKRRSSRHTHRRRN